MSQVRQDGGPHRFPGVSRRAICSTARREALWTRETAFRSRGTGVDLEGLKGGAVPAIGAGLAVVVLAVVAAAAASLGWQLTGDAPLMHYAAWRIAQGAVPYRDFLDMNLPGTYLLHLAAIGLFGPGDLAWRLFDLVWLGLGSGAAAAVACRCGTIAAVLAAGIIGIYHLSLGAGSMGQRDFFVAVLLLGSALALIRHDESGGRAGLFFRAL